jgi:hypothetical protein
MGRMLCVDPGEDTGFSVWDGNQLIEAGTEKLWYFADAVWAGLHGSTDNEDTAWISELLHPGVDVIVVEDWRLYPDEIKSGAMDWDQCRTARLIGALTFFARLLDIEFVLQPAKIKRQAEAAGAESLFFRPLHENRHANDSIRHGVYYLAVSRGAKGVEGMAFKCNDNPGKD